MARRAGNGTPLQRVLSFIVVFALSSCVALLAAHEERPDAGAGIAMVCFIVLGGTAWFVGWWRGAWRLDGNNSMLALFLAGLIGVAAAGPSAIQGVVLATRGEPTDVVLVAYGETDEDGARSYVLIRETEPFEVRGDLRTDRELTDGQSVNVLIDRGEFVRPAFSDDVEPTLWVLIAVFGIVCMAASTIGMGFPLGAGRRQLSRDDLTRCRRPSCSLRVPGKTAESTGMAMAGVLGIGGAT